jgi:uncharacterized membrane protein
VQVIIAGWNNFRSVISGFEIVKEQPITNIKTSEDENPV